MGHLFGARVLRLRTGLGITQKQLGEIVRVEHSRISQIERATGAKPTLPVAIALDEALGADGLLVDLWPHVYRESFPDWSRAYMDAEAKATEIWAYMGHTVHGLLQTPDYARAMLSMGRSLKTKEQLDERVDARLTRQDRLDSLVPPSLWVVLDESVLMRPVGGTAIMRGQLQHLIARAMEPHITIQVLPFAAGAHPAMGGSLNIATAPDGTTVAYTEGADSGHLVEDPEEVKGYQVTYDHVRAHALPPQTSLDLMRAITEENDRGPTRSQRRRLAQVVIQQSGGGRMLGGGRGDARRRPSS
ncbi:Scr1 family TA system antitoxin-like transcriptional regulator [Streptomyces sp. NPDC056909]|uniref:helix-turn-helix domain-containing protein n=1 Tax=Streptomyces sp. NPDC056909 TaxID=3345963 RepID=UPI0036CF387C